MTSLSHSVENLEASQTLAQTQRARVMREAGIDVVMLTAGEPNFPTPAHIKEAAIRAIRENHTYYTANQGTSALIEAVMRKFESENHLRFEPSNILVSTGGKQAIFNALCAILNPGDEVLIMAPYYVSFPSMVKLAGGTPRIVRLRREAGYRPDTALLREALNPKTRLLILNSPVNPTGNVFTADEIGRVAEFALKAGLTVISDEVYEKILFDGRTHVSIGSLEGMQDSVVTVNSLSKTFAMTGWRIGYMGGPKEIIRAAGKVQGQVTNNANAIAQEAARAALLGPADETTMMVREYARRRDVVTARLADVRGAHFRPPEGAFYAFVSLQEYIGSTSPAGKPMATADDIAQFLLEDHHVAVVSGSGFGDPSSIRLSYACDDATLTEGLERVHRGLEQLH